MANPTRVCTIPTDRSAIAARIKAAGGPLIDITQPTGQASGDGVTIGWCISGPVVTITLISKPWIIPVSTIWEHVDSIFD